MRRHKPHHGSHAPQKTVCQRRGPFLLRVGVASGHALAAGSWQHWRHWHWGSAFCSLGL
jgi:hypothetical protein